jgi:hypothetical protein
VVEDYCRRSSRFIDGNVVKEVDAGCGRKDHS